jgi:hypothetical protein
MSQKLRRRLLHPNQLRQRLILHQYAGIDLQIQTIAANGIKIALFRTINVRATKIAQIWTINAHATKIAHPSKGTAIKTRRLVARSVKVTAIKIARFQMIQLPTEEIRVNLAQKVRVVTETAGKTAAIAVSESGKTAVATVHNKHHNNVLASQVSSIQMLQNFRIWKKNIQHLPVTKRKTK